MLDDTCSAPKCPNARAPKPRTGPRSPYCSRACRDRSNYLLRREDILTARRIASASKRSSKACADCGVEFVPPNTSKQMYCSKSCAKRSENAKSITARPQCVATDCANKSVSGGLCRQHHPQGSTWSRGRPETRRSNLRRKTQLRRARSRDLNAESIDRDAVGERDAWKCGLCGHRVDNALAWPHPKSASLDHIQPLSLGGKHQLSNVQISHLDCNLAKGNRVVDVQPLLIG